jgi:DedD protein
MRRVFEDREIDEVEPKGETRGETNGESWSEAEFTLGTAGLVIVGCALLVICGLCFGLGYTIGSHGWPHSAPVNSPLAASSQPPSTAAGPRPKPSATPPQPAVAPANLGSAPNATDPDGDVVSVPDANGRTGSSSSPQGSSIQPAVRPALPSQPTQPPIQTSGTSPAIVPGPGIMVQIAAVSHAEDANVLVNALRRRGYAVSVRRDLSDNLLHVQVGPFNDRNDANAMRIKLLNDGYNAIVEP